ncbi:MAG: glycine cleavage system aminomethyltransferase GcvT [Christensenellales bacterium]
MDKKTPLYSRHVIWGGKMVSFGGYLLPVQYASGVIAEHMAVRTAAGLFDVSHMGQVLFTGKSVLACLNHLLTNDYTSMKSGRVRYGIMCNPDGGCVDDLVVMKLSDEAYLLVVNAANREKDLAWMTENMTAGTELRDLSDSIAMVALQGPSSPKILSKLANPDYLPQRYYTFRKEVEVAGIRTLISRTGYTGETGYELMAANEDAERLADALLEAGKSLGLIPCGLGSRDTLRLEAGMPLYGHEMDDTITPLEAGLDFAVKLTKESFVGKEALTSVPQRIRIGLKVTGRGIIREQQNLYNKDGICIGHSTSGTHGPYVGFPIAMALVKRGVVSIGDIIEADVRGRLVAAEVVSLPFYKKS